MAQTNRSFEPYATFAYPELQPIREATSVKPKIRHSRNKKKLTRSEYLLYLSINAALVFGVVQSIRTIIHDGVAISQLFQSQISVERFFSETKHENEQLKQKIRLYSSPSGIEELARNNLNMVRDNELPIRFR